MDADLDTYIRHYLVDRQTYIENGGVPTQIEITHSLSLFKPTHES